LLEVRLISLGNKGITNMLALPISKMLYIYVLYMDILFIPSLNGQVLESAGILRKKIIVIAGMKK
jgi:hypothetical protein